MMDESCRALFIMRPQSSSLERSAVLFSLSPGGEINVLREKTVDPSSGHVVETPGVLETPGVVLCLAGVIAFPSPGVLLGV